MAEDLQKEQRNEKTIKKQRLAATILLQLAIGGSFGQADAMTTSRIDYNGKPMFEAYYCNKSRYY